MRFILLGNSDLLELKNTSKGYSILNTRGQLGLNLDNLKESDSNIVAIIGFQRSGLSTKELKVLISRAIKSNSKMLPYLQFSLGW